MGEAPRCSAPELAKSRSGHLGGRWPFLGVTFPVCPLWPVQTAGMAFPGAFGPRILTLGVTQDNWVDVAVWMGLPKETEASSNGPFDHNLNVPMIINLLKEDHNTGSILTYNYNPVTATVLQYFNLLLVLA